ncbi:MAG: helix-turn-helix domain-containing protein [Pseudomonadota bacterium]
MVISRQNPPENRELSFPSSYLKLFLQQLVQAPEEQLALFQTARLPPDCLDQPALPLTQVNELVNAIDLQLPPGWHIQPCLRLEPAQHGPLGLAAISAATLADALATLARFERLRAPWAQAIGYRDGDRQVLELRQTLPLPDRAALLMEMNLLALAGLIAPLLGPDQRELVFETPEGELPWQAALEAALPGTLRLNAGRLALSLPQSVLPRPCLLADAELHDLMCHRCQRLLRDPGEQTLAAQVRATLQELSGPDQKLAVVAERLGRSARSLTRHLAAESLTFRQLVDETRLAQARELLRHSRLPVADIAWRLGYADPSNFNRAFRRWTGHSPGEERETAS